VIYPFKPSILNKIQFPQFQSRGRRTKKKELPNKYYATE